MSKVFKKTSNPNIVVWVNGDIDVNVPAGHPIFQEYLVMLKEGYIPIDAPPEALEDFKRRSYIEVDRYISDIRYQIADTTDDAEIAGWPVKFFIADNIQKGIFGSDSFEYKAFELEIVGRGLGETMPEFLSKVFKNAANYTFVTAVLDGEKYRIKLNIKKSTDYETINNLLSEMKKTTSNKVISALALLSSGST